MSDSAGGISSQSFLTIKINGEEMPASPGLVRTLHLIESSSFIPQAIMDLVDQKRTLRNELALVDGTRMEIRVGASQEQAETAYLSVLGTKEIETGGQRLLRVVCVLDAPSFIFDTKLNRFAGTSTQVLSQIASQYGLTYDGDISGSDSMSWLGIATSPRLFVRDIEQHMWVSEKAFPVISYTFDKQMLVRDLNTVIIGEPEQYFVFHSDTDKEGAIYFEELRPMSSSGAFNALSNYGDKAVWTDEDGAQTTLDSVTIDSNDNPNVSSSVREGIQGSKVRQLVPSPDSNSHKNWTKAKYNWTRQSLAYTENARGLVRGQASVGLLTCVEVISGQLSDRTGEEEVDEKNSHKWVVVGKTRSVMYGQYSEAYVLTRNYTTVSGNSEVGGGSNQVSVPAPTAASPVRPTQINPSIKQAADGISPIDKYLTKYDLELKLLDQKFMDESKVFAFPELVEKYGENIDYLKALMQEYSMANFLAKMCNSLNLLEKLSINISLEFGADILGSLADRIDQYGDLMGSMVDGLNDLVSSGDIPDHYLSGVKLNQKCVSNKIDDLVGAVNDLLPSKCIDAHSMGSLTAPSMSLGSVIRQWEEFLRDMLCSLGDGTVDGSSLDGAPGFGELSDYVPDASGLIPETQDPSSDSILGKVSTDNG